MTTTDTVTTDRLHAVAILRNGKVHKYYPRGGSHSELRLLLTGDDIRHLGDIEGFITTAGNFLTRREAVAVGIKSGQINERWLDCGRDLLSSDVNW